MPAALAAFAAMVPANAAAASHGTSRLVVNIMLCSPQDWWTPQGRRPHPVPPRGEPEVRWLADTLIQNVMKFALSNAFRRVS
jgi:hypothetical protein